MFLIASFQSFLVMMCLYFVVIHPKTNILLWNIFMSLAFYELYFMVFGNGYMGNEFEVSDIVIDIMVIWVQRRDSLQMSTANTTNVINNMLKQMFILKSENISAKIDHRITFFLQSFLRNRGQKSSLCLGSHMYRVSHLFVIGILFNTTNVFRWVLLVKVAFAKSLSETHPVAIQTSG